MRKISKSKRQKTAGKPKSKTRYERLFLLFAGIIFLDRLLKNYAVEGCLWQACIKRAVNFGASFGILNGYQWLFIAVAILVLTIISVLIWKVESRIKLAFTLIAAGTVGNVIDRIALGYVIDIFSIFGSSSFNLADLSNTLGGILIIVYLLKKK